MKKLVALTVILIAGFIMNAGNLAFAHAVKVPIPLFDATPTANTPRIVPDVFKSTRVMVDFKTGDKAVISANERGTEPIVVDNFIIINGIVNACEGLEGQTIDAPDSCFGKIKNRSLPTGRPIEEVLTPIGPVDVSEFIPVGTTDVLFELSDIGNISGNPSIQGNTTLFLVITTVPGGGGVGPNPPAVDLRAVARCDGVAFNAYARNEGTLPTGATTASVILTRFMGDESNTLLSRPRIDVDALLPGEEMLLSEIPTGDCPTEQQELQDNRCDLSISVDKGLTSNECRNLGKEGVVCEGIETNNSSYGTVQQGECSG